MCLRPDEAYYIDHGPLFASLPELVDYYVMFTDGLPALLRYPVPPSPSDYKVPAELLRPVSYF